MEQLKRRFTEDKFSKIPLQDKQQAMRRTHTGNYETWVHLHVLSQEGAGGGGGGVSFFFFYFLFASLDEIGSTPSGVDLILFRREEKVKMAICFS